MPPQPASQEILHRIRRQGKITFAEFMQLALYWPNGGYYSGTGRSAPARDYYTAPGAHPAFGALLAVQLFQMWRRLDEPRPFCVVEPGAGNGLLSHAIVAAAAHLPGGFPQALRYLCVDVRTGIGVESGLTLGGETVGRVAALGLPIRPFVGCILSNELLDAFPVHLVEQENGLLLEVYVESAGEGFTERLDRPSTGALARRLEELGVRLNEGQRAEVNLALGPWIREAATALRRGYLVTIDYGREAEDLYSAERPRGTLTCHHNQMQTDNPFLHVGFQDVTAQVDFTSVVRLGDEVGLRPVAYLPQGQAFTNLGIRRMMGALTALDLSQAQRDANRMGMLDLIRPGGMGDFRVLVQQKAAPAEPLWCQTPDQGLERILPLLPTPLLSELHVPLLAAKYPHLAQDWGTLDSKAP